MRSLRRKIELKDGVKVDLLFTPHLFSFKDDRGLSLEATAGDMMQIMEVYADIMFLAGINAWYLDGHGEPETFPYTRGDFHEYMTARPKTFAEDVAFAVEALTGRKLGEAKDVKADEAEDGKKKVLPRIMRRSRPSS